MGILFFASVITIMIIYLIREKKKKQFWHLGFFILVAALTLFTTWPYLWTEPIAHIRNSFNAMSKFRWQGTYLLNGVVFHEGENIRNYLFRWMGITIPVLYLIIGLLGMMIFAFRNFLQPRKILDHPTKILGWVFFAHIIIPIAAVLYFKSVLYDDWRQLYFIYPSFLFFCGSFLLLFFEKFYKWFKRMAFVIMAYLGFILAQMIILHPYQHVYFNELVPHKKDFLQQHYDQDYWGTGFYAGLKFVLKHDQADTIPIYLYNDALQRNTWLLKEEERKRIVFVTGECPGTSRYHITGFRADYTDILGTCHYKEVIYEIKRQNSVILRVWKK